MFLVFLLIVVVFATEHPEGILYTFGISTKIGSDQENVESLEISTAEIYGTGIVHLLTYYTDANDNTYPIIRQHPSTASGKYSAFGNSFQIPVDGIAVGMVQTYLIKVGSPSGTLKAGIYNTTSHIPTTSICNSSTSVDIETLTGTYTLYNFNFTNSPAFYNGTEYAWVIYSDDGVLDDSNYVRIAVKNTGSYSLGQACNFANSAFATFSSSDTRFLFYGTTANTDSEAPTYSGLSSSTTDKETVCDFNATFNDETALESSGTYYFSTNNTGTWTNNTVASFSSTPETISVQKTLNSTVGQVVGCKWFFSDNAGNWNSTSIETLTITDITVASYGIENQDNTSKKTKVHPSTTSGKSGHSQEFTGDPTMYFYSTQVYMKKVGSPVGVLSASLYNEAGGLPTTLVEASITTVTMESLTTDFVLYAFNFSRTSKFSAQDYAITVLVDSATTLDDDNYVVIGTGGDGTGTGKKNGHYKNGGWEEDPDVDMIFYIYGGTVSSTPTYSSVSHSSTEAGIQSLFNITANDDVVLESGGQYIFATNNTGTWVLDSAINFTSTPESVSTSKTLNSTFGLVVGYRWFIDDHAGNANNTAIYTLTTTDTISPTYSAVSKSTSEAEGFCLFNITVNDNSALESDGQYQFATNNTGAWVWDSAINFTSTSQIVTVTKQLNETLTQVVGYRWNITDNQGNSNSTAISTLTIVADGTAPSIASVSHSNTGLLGACIFKGYVSDSCDMVDGGWIFSNNLTGTWSNSTYLPFTEHIGEWVEKVDVIGSVGEQVVGYRWYYNDTAGNWGTSSVYTLITDDESLGGGGDESGDQTDPINDEDDPTGTIVPLFNLPQAVENLVTALRTVPAWVLWGVLAILGAVAVVGAFNQQLGKRVGRYGRAPQRKVADSLTAQKDKAKKKIKRPRRSWKLFD